MKESLVYPFVLTMWTEKKIDEAFIRGQEKLNRLTLEEVETILSTTQKE